MEKENASDPTRNAGGRELAKRVLVAIDKLAKLDGWLGALCLTLLCLLMIAGIVVRTLSTLVRWFPKDIPIAWEYSSYLMAVTFTFGAALTLRAGGHIRVRLLLSNASPVGVKSLEGIAAATGQSTAIVLFTYDVNKPSSSIITPSLPYYPANFPTAIVGTALVVGSANALNCV